MKLKEILKYVHVHKFTMTDIQTFWTCWITKYDLRFFPNISAFGIIFFLPTQGGQSNNIEESTVMSLFASGYETKVGVNFLWEHVHVQCMQCLREIVLVYCLATDKVKSVSHSWRVKG